MANILFGQSYYLRFDPKLWRAMQPYPPLGTLYAAAAVRKAGFDKLHFAWLGGPDRGQPHYYRIQGSSFLIEYDNTQGSANHIHSVWREFKGDWGKDVLAEHYRTAPHHADHRGTHK